MTLVLLNDTNTAGPVAVNPVQIRFMREGPQGRVTIVFDGDQSLTVDSTLAEVTSQLRAGSTS